MKGREECQVEPPRNMNLDSEVLFLLIVNLIPDLLQTSLLLRGIPKEMTQDQRGETPCIMWKEHILKVHRGVPLETGPEQVQPGVIPAWEEVLYLHRLLDREEVLCLLRLLDQVYMGSMDRS